MLSTDVAAKFRRMKAAPILAFARDRGLDEAQLRRWRSNGGLHFGTPSEVEGGHPSYHLADAGLVLLIEQMRRRGVSASDIPHIANLANPVLYALSERLLDNRPANPAAGDEMRVILDLSTGTEFLARDSQTFVQLLQYSGLMSVLFFDLEAIARYAFQQLAGYFNISVASLGEPVS